MPYAVTMPQTANYTASVRHAYLSVLETICVTMTTAAVKMGLPCGERMGHWTRDVIFIL